jgi:hypothetical protein
MLNHELLLIDSDKIAIPIWPCPRIGQEDQLSYLVPQYLGLAVAKMKSIDRPWKHTDERPPGKLERWGQNQDNSRVLTHRVADYEQGRYIFSACSVHIETIHFISTMLCQ